MITIDATALTFDTFRIPGVGQFPTHTPQVLDLAPGRYRFCTLYGAEFEFSVDDAGIVNYNKDLTFLTGTGTGVLTVLGCKIQVDATALTFDSFGLYDSASGLNHCFPSTSAQVARLIPGHYRFGTLYGAVFDFTVTNSCTVNYDPGLTFLTGAGTGVLTVLGCEIKVDATALTFGSFGLYDSASGLTRYIPSASVQVVRLIPGHYRFGTLYGAIFDFTVNDGCTVDYDPGLTFLAGTGTGVLTVLGCEIQVDATALTFDSFGLYDSASGLMRYIPSASVQVVRLIPGHYRFGTLHGAIFDFTVTNGCTVDYDPGLTFLTGAGTGVLEVVGFLVNVDARPLAAASFELGDSASGLAVSLPTARPHCVTLIPGSYVFRCGFTFGFSISTGGTFDFDLALVRCVSGLGRQRVRVLCDPTGP